MSDEVIICNSSYCLYFILIEKFPNVMKKLGKNSFYTKGRKAKGGICAKNSKLQQEIGNPSMKSIVLYTF